jgi:hypothetical protein
MATWRNRRDAQKQLSEIEKSYAREERITPADGVVRMIWFSELAVSRTRPMTAIITINEQTFSFAFK